MTTEQEAPVAADEGLLDIAVSADLSTGSLLLAAREAAGLSEKDIAEQLHITVHYVKALETDHYEKLPGAIFVKGYIKSYAALLGEDPDRLIRLYNEHASSQEHEAKEQTRLQAKRRKDKNLPWVVVSVLVFVGGFIGLWYYNTRVVAPADAVIEQAGTLGQASEDSSAASPARLRTLEEQPSSTPGTVLDRVVAPPSSVSPAEVAEQFSTQLVEEIQSLAVANEESATIQAEDLLTEAESAPAGSDTEAAEANEADVAVEISESAPSQPDEPELPVVEPSGTAAEEQDSTETTAASRQDVAAVEEEVVAVEEVEEEPEIGRSLSIGESGEDSLRFEFSGESWVEVADASSTILYRDIRIADDVLIIRGQAPFNVLVGNASRTVLTLNGELIDVGARMRIDNTARITVGR